MMHFIIEGEIIPYVRTTRKAASFNERNLRYANSLGGIRVQVNNQMALRNYEKIPDRTSFIVYALFQSKSRLWTFDVDNKLKAIVDALQGHVFRSDLWLRETWGRKELGTDDMTAIVLDTLEHPDPNYFSSRAHDLLADNDLEYA